MNASPLFSIIMPTHNRANLIPAGIESILAQSCTDWELLLIDDGSTDPTKTVVEQYADARIRYHYQAHGERSAARNKGIELSRGRYLCFIDDDDYFLPHHLETFQQAIDPEQKNPPILRVGYLREKGQEKKPTHLYDPATGIHPAHYSALHFCGVWSLAIPREYLQEHQFAPAFRHWQDTHLIIRLLALFPFQQLQASTYVYRIHQGMGSLRVYQEPDARARIESNVAAIHDLFERYPDLVKTVLPPEMHDFLVCQKYSDHAHGALVSGNLPLAWELFLQSWKYNTGRWFYPLYFRFLLKMPLKKLTGYPRVT